MVQSNAMTVADWIDRLAVASRPVIEQFRLACLQELDGWEERMQWGMPGYGPSGHDNVVSFNSQKRHFAFYPGPAAIERFRDELAGLDCGKGCVRFRNASQIDFAVVQKMLRDIRERNGPMC